MGESWCVYIHEHIESGKRYIGITSSHPPSGRWRKNGAGYKRCPIFYNAIKKYGWDAFRHEVLYTDLTQEQAEQLEMDLIARYHTQDTRYGYNIREGGQASHRSPATRAKISASLRGRGRAVECVETRNTYGSIGEASRCCNVNRGSIHKASNNPSRVAGGYHWRFI